MTGRRIYSVLTGIMLAAVLVGCGDGTEDISPLAVVFPEPVTVTLEPVAAGSEMRDELRLLYSTGNLTEEEESIILENMKTLHQDLELPEYVGEGISLVNSGDWFEAMTPRLYEGSRNYILQKGGQTLLSVLVAYDIAGEPRTNVFFEGLDNKVLLLWQEGSVTQLVQTFVSEEGLYDGGFELWRIDGATGEIRHEQGTYAAGVIVGDYTISVCSAPSGAAFDLWTNRESFTYETSTVTYDKDGNPVSTATPVPTATPTRQPAATQKPATPKPAVTQPPQTPAPTPEPAPPAQDDDDDDDDPGWSPAEPGDNNGGGSTGTGGSTDTGSTSGDVDVDWSEDML